MADVHSNEVRSYNMSKIRNKNTKPEILVRHFLHSQGYRFRLHDRKLPGKPDIILPKYRTVILIQGCFWHGHEGCKYFVVPKTRTEWWLSKINSNKARDEKNILALKELGWNVIQIWECELKKENRFETLFALKRELNNIWAKIVRMRSFGKYIRELREQKELSLRKAAAYLDTDSSILSKIEKGESEANKELVVKIAGFYALDQKNLLAAYFSDTSAIPLYQEPSANEIMAAAEEKATYIKSKKKIK